jgi:hypothetical protein
MTKKFKLLREYEFQSSIKSSVPRGSKNFWALEKSSIETKCTFCSIFMFGFVSIPCFVTDINMEVLLSEHFP